MPYCPKCRSEYVETVKTCVHCEVELVASLPESDLQKGDRLREQAAAGKAARIARASYTDACQMVELLQTHGLDAMVVGDESSCGKSGQCSHFWVAVLPEDVDASLLVMQTEFRKLVEVDAECQGADPDAAVDFDAEGPRKCPACGASFEGLPEECPECGLFLGAA